MASLSGVKSASGTLVAATVDTVTLSYPYTTVTVLNNGAGVIHFTVDGTTPTTSEGFVVGAGLSVVAPVPQRQQGESAQVNGSAGPTWTYAADGTPVPSAWVTTASGAKFSRGTDDNNILTNAAASSTAVVKLISAGTPTYSVIGG